MAEAARGSPRPQLVSPSTRPAQGEPGMVLFITITLVALACFYRELRTRRICVFCKGSIFAMLQKLIYLIIETICVNLKKNMLIFINLSYRKTCLNIDEMSIFHNFKDPNLANQTQLLKTENWSEITIKSCNMRPNPVICVSKWLFFVALCY